MVFTTVPVVHAIILAPKLARRAYTLVQISNPSIDLKSWIRYVRDCAKVRSRSSGLVAMVDERTYVHGVFAWSLVPDVSHRNSLQISDIILADAPGLSLARSVILAFQDLAEAKGAGIVVILAVKEAGALCRNAALTNGFTLAGELLQSVFPTSPEPAIAAASGPMLLGQWPDPTT